MIPLSVKRNSTDLETKIGKYQNRPSSTVVEKSRLIQSEGRWVTNVVNH